MPNFYHVSLFLLRSGLELESGHWGEEIRTIPTNISNNLLSIVCETIFDIAREELIREGNELSVSRLNCVFGCKTLEAAIDFINRYSQGQSRYVYEIEVIAGTPLFYGDSTLVCGSTVEQIRSNAKRYWKKEFSVNGIEEVLIGGKAKVIRQIE